MPNPTPDQVFEQSVRDLTASPLAEQDLADFVNATGRGGMVLMLGRLLPNTPDALTFESGIALLILGLSPDGGFPSTPAFTAALNQLRSDYANLRNPG